MSNNMKFITNNENNSLISVFNQKLIDTKFFDCIVGYFYLSGFKNISKQLKNVDKVRILVGMGTDSFVYNILDNYSTVSSVQLKESVVNSLNKELNFSENSIDFENSIRDFYNYLKEGKIVVKAYKKRNLHSKVYIFSNDDDSGSVITGSSNLTSGGLVDNLEFNVLLDDYDDYIHAKNIFDEYWVEAIDVSEDFINTLDNSWSINEVSSKELYFKFLYEYFSNQIDWDKNFNKMYNPNESFENLQYQVDAVIQAKRIINDHNGVFLADVVGLGKTFMGVMLLQQLKGKSLVIVPPQLLKNSGPGSWKFVLNQFDVDCDIFSSGNLKNLINEKKLDLYKNVLIDEAHSFRNEKTQKYDNLQEICRNKKVVLLSATPYNNDISDILSLIKLFQPAHNSTLPNHKVKDIENYFSQLKKRVAEAKDISYEKYIEERKSVVQDLKENVLRYLMVRRTRNDIAKFYPEDAKKVTIPECENPEKVRYNFNEEQNELFDYTLKVINNELTYARYTPFLEKYYKDKKGVRQQKNMKAFIKILLFKRLESDIESFKKTLRNFINSHENIIKEFDNGNFNVLKSNYSNHYLDYDYLHENLLESNENNEENNKVTSYPSEKFKNIFREDLINDIRQYKSLLEKWDSIDDYPKRKELLSKIKKLINNKEKVIIFTEFIDTAKELKKELNDYKVLVYTGKSSIEEQEKVIQNFDANVKDGKNDYDILISTDVLSHGVNLHRARNLINYDIPWNPTKIMQRVGRIQRVQKDKRMKKKIQIYNFFPESKIESSIGIGKTAEEKINYFIGLLGNDSKILMGEEITSNELFDSLNKNPDQLEDGHYSDELEYLKIIRELRDSDHKDDKELYDKIKNLSLKSRIAVKDKNESVITLFKVNETPRIIISNKNYTKEIDFLEAVKFFENYDKEENIPVSESFYDLLNHNIEKLKEILLFKTSLVLTKNEKSVLFLIEYILSHQEELESDQIKYFKKLKKMVKEGLISQQDCIEIKKQKKHIPDSKKIYKNIQKIISKNEVFGTVMTTEQENREPKIILSKEFRG